MNIYLVILLFIFSLVVVYFWIRLLIKLFKWALKIMNPPDLPEGEEE